MKLFKAWGPVIIWMVVIFYLSHQPAEQSSGLSNGITLLVSNIIQNILPIFKIDYTALTFIVRKLAHLIAYLILGYLLMRALSQREELSFRIIGQAFFICVMFAISDEIHQLFIPGRSGEVRDVIIDSIGVIFGIAIFYLLHRRKEEY